MRNCATRLFYMLIIAHSRMRTILQPLISFVSWFYFFWLHSSLWQSRFSLFVAVARNGDGEPTWIKRDFNIGTSRIFKSLHRATLMEQNWLYVQERRWLRGRFRIMITFHQDTKNWGSRNHAMYSEVKTIDFDLLYLHDV